MAVRSPSRIMSEGATMSDATVNDATVSDATVNDATVRDATVSARKPARLGHIDGVRSLVIFLVVMLHSSVTYSGLGGWYITENAPDKLGIAELVVFGLFNSFNQAWFMGILFFFGGYFASDALARKGSGSFVRDRLLRLGLPLAFYVFIINPLQSCFLVSPELLRGGISPVALYFGMYIGQGMFLGSTGPLWFAEALLIFSLVYAAVRRIAGPATPNTPPLPATPLSATVPVRGAPTTSRLVALIALTAVIAFAVRIVMPIGTNWLNLQFCFFPAYVVLFWLGCRGFSGSWFVELTGGKRSRWLVAVFAIGIPLWLATMVQGGALRGELDAMNGGLNLTSALYCLWESFTAVGMSVGLTAAFANRARKPGKISALLSRNSFSVFVFHAPVLIGLTRLLSGWAAPALVKAPVVGLLAWSVTMAFAEFVVRRVPIAKKYL
jgi:hypothetical protein